MGAASSLLQPGEYANNIRAEFRLEGVGLKEAEVLEQPFEEVSGEVLGWKGCMVVLGIAGRGSE